MPLAIADIHGVNTPTLIGATGIASHPPTKLSESLNRWQVHHGRDEAFRVATPCLQPGNWTTPIAADGTVVAAHQKSAGRHVLKRIATVTAELQHATIEAQIRIRIRCFKIIVLTKRQTWIRTFEKREGQRVETFVANHGWIIYESSIRRRVSGRHGYSRV